ncbi:hypothetical protein [Gracilimonas tropica]|uniref:hypothetical protein n=1 Tax=Gracilimonas tropica TaxID=454600 RepID=UPI0003683A51|nr:hypothetical protein [Gracilimonas tropica]
MKKILYISVFASFIFLSCNSSVDSLGDENLSITTKESAVILTNNSDEVIHYILLEYETSTLVDLDPNAEWPTIEGNSKVSIPYSEIMGYQESSDEAFIMWGIEKRSSGNSLKFKL